MSKLSFPPCAGGLCVDAYIFLDIVTIPFLYERTIRRRTQTHRKLPPACGHRVDTHNVTHIPPPPGCRPTKPHLCPFYPRRTALRCTRLTIRRSPIPIPEESGLSPIRVPHAHNAAKYPLEVAVREAHHAPYSLCLSETRSDCWAPNVKTGNGVYSTPCIPSRARTVK